MEKKPFKTVALKTRLSPHLFERRAYKQGLLVCGIDEAGRGPLAGPVVAAAAILKIGKKHPLLIDSKELKPEQRDIAFDWLLQNSWYGVGVVSARNIEKWGIYRSTLIAMQRAYYQLITCHAQIPACILVDAMPLKLENCLPADLPNTLIDIPSDDPMAYPWHKIIYFPHSEKLSRSIAAASIIAKVTRDRIITTAADIYPGYDFQQHKGYATALHQKLRREKGICIIHRPSYIHDEEPQEQEETLLIPFEEFSEETAL